MEQIEVNDLDIQVVQTITGLKLNNARSVERTETGLKSNVQVVLMSGDAPLGNRKVRQAIQDNTFVTFDELNAQAQAEHGKDFDELTVVESHPVHGNVLAQKMIVAINDAETGITVEDVSALVIAIIKALG